MTVAALVADLRARGVTLEPRGDKLAVRPVSRVRPDELAALRQRKAEVLAILTSPVPVIPPAPEPAPTLAARYFHPWPDSLPGLGPRRVIAFSPCLDCETDPPPDRTVRLGPYTFTVPGDRGTWIEYGGRPLCQRHASTRAGGRP